MRKYEKNKETVEVDFEGDGLAPISLEAIKSGAIIIVLRSSQKEERMSKKRILIIDDDESTREVFADHFESIGYEVFVAKNGAEGIKMVTENCFDLVITDHQMPGMLGEEVVRIIKSNFPEVKVVFTSVVIDAVVASVAKAAGADLVIEKLSNLPEVVHKFLEGGK